MNAILHLLLRKLELIGSHRGIRFFPTLRRREGERRGGGGGEEKTKSRRGGGEEEGGEVGEEAGEKRTKLFERILLQQHSAV